MTRAHKDGWFRVGVWLAGALFGLWTYLAIAKYGFGLGE